MSPVTIIVITDDEHLIKMPSQLLLIESIWD